MFNIEKEENKVTSNELGGRKLQLHSLIDFLNAIKGISRKTIYKNLQIS